MVCLCTTGCWDSLEIEQRAMVLGLSVDIAQVPSDDSHFATERNTGNASESPRPLQVQGRPESEAATARATAKETARMPIRLTAQIPIPGRIPLGPGESGGGGANNPSQSVWVVHSTGETVTEALQCLQQQVADPLFFGHLRVIVVSREFAQKRGLSDLMDYLRRNPQVRRTLWILVSEHEAAKLLATAPPLKRVPTLYLISTMDQAIRLGKFPTEFLGVAESKVVMKGRDMVLPYVDVQHGETMLLQGMAFFRDYRLAGVVTGIPGVYTYMELCGIRQGGIVDRAQLPGGSWVVLQSYRRRRSIRLQMVQDQPVFDVYVHIDFHIHQTSGDPLNLSNPATLRLIERRESEKIISAQKDLIRRTQQAGSDIVGFGEFVRAYRPGWWDAHIQTKDRWREVYKTLPVHLHVKSRVRVYGMRAR
ncbi:MAG: Ger(x)C family spore germination protein [Alicyclobacillus shizuokensis]|nr:Ger(x)C family spore germination protein [Alicyclobacillus shizuokensis]